MSTDYTEDKDIFNVQRTYLITFHFPISPASTLRLAIEYYFFTVTKDRRLVRGMSPDGRTWLLNTYREIQFVGLKF